MTLPTPVEFGAPKKFDRWRTSQEEALIEAMQSKKRFVVLALPTGVGKTLVSVVYALFNGEGTYIVATRGQQDQVGADFIQAGMVDVRGMSNYKCLEHPRGADCSHGKCLTGSNCYRRAGGCLYYDAVRRAQASPFPLTNYAFWLTDGAREGMGEGQGPRLSASTLICDEAHLIGNELSRHLSVTVRQGEVKTFPKNLDSWPIPNVVGWIKDEVKNIARCIAKGKMDEQEAIAAKALRGRLALAAGAKQGDWVVENAGDDKYKGKGWTIAPVYPEQHAARIWRDADKVLLVSATIRPKALELLGLSPSDYDFLEYPSPLPMHRRPIVHLQIPGKTTRMSFRSTRQTVEHWVEKMDSIIETRQDRKGIIHTVSYQRAMDIRGLSRFGHLMLLPSSRTTRQDIEHFRKAKPPLILVSPSVGTGYDFPFDAARWQIIAKIPFPDGRGAVMKARTKLDKDYPLYLALTEVVQMAGRVMRAEGDYGETFIVDDQIAWLMWKHGQYVPGWFKSAFSRKSVAPAPKKITVAKKAVDRGKRFGL